MIIIIVGGIGSGKSLSVVKELIERSDKSLAYVNFTTKGIKNVVRLTMDMILNYEVDKKGKRSPTSINFDYWANLRKENKSFSIYLDEVHNIIHSRQGMSKQNILLTKWLAQIRKVFGSAEKDHLYLITQRLGRIDVALRELAHYIIECDKVVKGKDVWIIKKVYQGVDGYNSGVHMFKSCFKGNPFFNKYDSYEFITLGNENYL